MRTKQEIITELVTDVEHVAIGTEFYFDRDFSPEIVSITIAGPECPPLKTGGSSRGLVQIWYADGTVATVARNQHETRRVEPAPKHRPPKEAA